MNTELLARNVAAHWVQSGLLVVAALTRCGFQSRGRRAQVGGASFDVRGDAAAPAVAALGGPSAGISLVAEATQSL